VRLGDAAVPLATRQVGAVEVVAVAPLADALAAQVARHGSLHAWAGTVPQRRTLMGRAPVHVAPLPGTDAVVAVRHAWHGGLLAPLTRDRFLRPSRAPHELRQSAALRAAGIPSTEVLGFARTALPLWRCTVDVVSRYEPASRDLGAVLAGEADAVASPEAGDGANTPLAAAVAPAFTTVDALAATGRLLRQLTVAGVVHPDLNVKNVLLRRPAAGGCEALLIDVDVVRWTPHRRPQRVLAANLGRLTHSMRRQRERYGSGLAPAAVTDFERAVREAHADVG
jgi:3-deoxy-D-manno-octulosonic acid kinase